jgi:hypothetical protein
MLNLTPKSALEYMTEAWKALRALTNVTHKLLYEAARERDRLLHERHMDAQTRAADEAANLEHQRGLELHKQELLATMKTMAAESPIPKIIELVKLIDEYEANKSNPHYKVSGGQAYQAELQLRQLLRKL